jgi:riboflavin kinase/FMN adenylyltransferase
VHRGHQAVIARVQQLAAERGLLTAVVTFDRHPAAVVRPESAPKLLTDLDQKLELLAATGVDVTLVVTFDAVRSQEPASQFVTEVLVDALSARLVVVGEDFHFGHKRQGNVALLAAMGATHHFGVIGLELVGTDGRPAVGAERVSSTAIRSALGAGDVAAAALMLGRPHEVRGRFTSGPAGVGPRAAVTVPADICLPAPGGYRGRLLVADRPPAEVVVQVTADGELADAGAQMLLPLGTAAPVGSAAGVQFLAAADEGSTAL